MGRVRGVGAAPSRAEEWTTPEKLEELKQIAGRGVTLSTIAKTLGIDRSTLFDWRKRFPSIDSALKSGADMADDAVEDALHKAAVEGNITAQIFWLKNRRSTRWRDKRDTELSGSGKVSFEWDGAKENPSNNIKEENPGGGSE